MCPWLVDVSTTAYGGLLGILKCEMYYLNHFDAYEELVVAVEQFIHHYNHRWRRHKLNCLPPATCQLPESCLKENQDLISEILEKLFLLFHLST